MDDFCIGLTVSVSLMDEEALSRLKKLVESKKILLSHAFKTDNIEIIVEEDRISFPWFEIRCADAHDAYLHFIVKFCTLAKKQTRVLSKERKVENEREAFRYFLIRLGFVGDKYKKDRRILLRYLK